MRPSAKFIALLGVTVIGMAVGARNVLRASEDSDEHFYRALFVNGGALLFNAVVLGMGVADYMRQEGPDELEGIEIENGVEMVNEQIL